MSETDERVRRDTPGRHRETEFFNEHDGIHGRAPGEYLDIQEREVAEMARAKTEKRRADFDNLPATAGTPLVVKERLREVAQSAASPLNNDTEKVATLPVDQTTPAEAANRDTAYKDMVAAEERESNTGTNEPGPVEPVPSTPIMPDLGLGNLTGNTPGAATPQSNTPENGPSTPSV